MPNPFDDRRPQARAKIAALYAFLIAANCAVWAWAWLSFLHQPTLMGTAFLAYLFGLRHAFDADHIAAIDNVVRKLMQEGKYPVSVGFFFAIGHSTIVVLASIAIAATAAAMQGRLEVFHDLGGTIGTAIAALFLLVIGLANLFVLKGIWAVFAHVRRGGQLIDKDLDALLAGRGFCPHFSADIQTGFALLAHVSDRVSVCAWL
jgi:nickel/cobalt transporter (NiCoT) family protein